MSGFKELIAAWSPYNIFWYGSKGDRKLGIACNRDKWIVRIEMEKDDSKYKPLEKTLNPYAHAYDLDRFSTIDEWREVLEKTKKAEETAKIIEHISILEENEKNELVANAEAKAYYTKYEISVSNGTHNKALYSRFPSDNRLLVDGMVWEKDVANYEVDIIKYVAKLVRFIEMFVEVTI